MNVQMILTAMIAVTVACKPKAKVNSQAHKPPKQLEDLEKPEGSQPPAPEAPKSQEPPVVTQGQSSFDYSNLNYGLYWFNENNEFAKDQSPIAKNFYDPDKPTLIYVHGWQPDTIRDGGFESFKRTIGETTMDVSPLWKGRDWNIAIFFWQQFSDDDLLTAERKIWDKSVMSWKNNQEVSAPFNGNKSASELFFDAYQGFSTKQNNREIRLAGHSLGSQMASSLMGQILDHNAASKQKLHIPERLILLDPFFSANGKEYLQDAWTGERVRDIVDRIQTRTSTSIEAYRSSAVGFAPVAADQNRPLTEKVAFIELNSTGFLSQLDQAAKHNYAPLHYFWSIDFPPPGTLEEDGATKVLGISASTPLKDIQTFIQSGLRARVVQGGDSASPRDDIHEVRAQ